MSGIIINGTLVLFGGTMIYMLLWRVLFFDTNREPDPMAIEAFVVRCKRGGSLESKGRFGAIQKCFDEAGRDAVALRTSLERFRRVIERLHDPISVVANAAMGIGFLGTVVSMAGAAGGRVDPVSIIGLGMMSTMYGLIIALPGNMFHGLTNRRVLRLLDCVDTLLEALDGRINPPTSPAPVPSPNGSPDNGRHHQRVSEAETGNGRHGRIALIDSEADGCSERAEAKSAPAAAAASHKAHESAIDRVLAGEAEINEKVVGWLTTTGDVQNETTT